MEQNGIKRQLEKKMEPLPLRTAERRLREDPEDPGNILLYFTALTRLGTHRAIGDLLIKDKYAKGFYDVFLPGYSGHITNSKSRWIDLFAIMSSTSIPSSPGLVSLELRKFKSQNLIVYPVYLMLLEEIDSKDAFSLAHKIAVIELLGSIPEINVVDYLIDYLQRTDVNILKPKIAFALSRMDGLSKNKKREISDVIKKEVAKLGLRQERAPAEHLLEPLGYLELEDDQDFILSLLGENLDSANYALNRNALQGLRWYKDSSIILPYLFQEETLEEAAEVLTNLYYRKKNLLAKEERDRVINWLAYWVEEYKNAPVGRRSEIMEYISALTYLISYFYPQEEAYQVFRGLESEIEVGLHEQGIRGLRIIIGHYD